MKPNSDIVLINLSIISFMFQRLRIWSRAGIIFYLILLHEIMFWSMGLVDISTPQMSFIMAIAALVTPIVGFYLNSSKNLYEWRNSITYTSPMIKFIDIIAYILDKMRVFPIILLVYYAYLLYSMVLWGMDLGIDMTGQQAALIGSMAGSASIIFGFFINTAEVDKLLEDQYMMNIYTEENSTVDLSNVKTQIKVDVQDNQ